MIRISMLKRRIRICQFQALLRGQIYLVQVVVAQAVVENSQTDAYAIIEPNMNGKC